jgi:hypothetical protein
MIWSCHQDRTVDGRAIRTQSPPFTSTGSAWPVPRCADASVAGRWPCEGARFAGCMTRNANRTRQGAGRGGFWRRWGDAVCCRWNSRPWQDGGTRSRCRGTRESDCAWRLSWRGTGGTANRWPGTRFGARRLKRSGRHDEAARDRDRDRTGGTTRDSRDTRDKASGQCPGTNCISGSSPIGFNPRSISRGSGQSISGPNTGGNARLSGSASGET